MSEKIWILVVDDEPNVQLVLKDALEHDHCSVVLASTAAEALEAMATRRFHATVVDKNLPDRDGLDLLGAMRALDPELEAIMMTGYATLESVLKAIELGLFDYVTKPFDHVSGIARRVGRAVEKRQRAEDLKNLLVYLGATNGHLSVTINALKDAYRETVKVLCRYLTLEKTGAVFPGGSVRELTADVASALGMRPAACEWLEIAALVVDLDQTHLFPARQGARRVDEPATPRRLGGRPREVEVELLRAIVDFEPLAEVLRHRTEHFDGSGSPDGQASEGISISSRILAAATCYVGCPSPATGAAELEKRSGRELDPRVVRTLLDVVEHGDRATAMTRLVR